MSELEKELFDLGFRCDVLGFKYLASYIKNMPNNTTKGKMHIYEKVAKEYNTTPVKVERSIRHCKNLNNYHNYTIFDLATRIKYKLPLERRK